MGKNCTQCGEVLKDGINSCPKCASNQRSAINPKQTSFKNKKTSLKILIVVAGILAFAIWSMGMYMLYQYITNKPLPFINGISVEKPFESVQMQGGILDAKKIAIEKEKPLNVLNNAQIPEQLILADFSLGGVNIGDNVSRVERVKGTPRKIREGRYVYDDIHVVFEGGLVSEIWSNDSSLTTRRNIRQNENYDEVIKAYGDNATKEKYGDLLLLEYRCKNNENQTYILRFAINSQNKVQYISVRIL